MTQPTSWPVFAGIDWGGSHHDCFDAFVLADTLHHEHQHWRVLSVPLRCSRRSKR
jgi:hypothetical protein